MDMSPAYREGGRDAPAQGEARLRPLPCRQAVQREALRSPPRAAPRGDRRAAQEGTQGYAWLLLKNPENLDTAKDEKRRLEEALALNEPLATAYYLKEDLRQFWEQPDKRFATLFLDGWIRRAEASGIKMLQQMAKTLARTGVVCWRTTTS